MKNYSRVQSYAIVNHACEVASKRGETQTDVTVFIDVDPGHFSRCKSGKKSLAQEKLRQLIEKYGSPNFLQSGVYKQAERYLGVDEFLSNYKTSHELYVANQQLSYWKRPEFQRNISLFLHLKDITYGAPSEQYEKLKEKLKEVMADEAFHEWFDLYSPTNTNNSLIELLGIGHETHEYPNLDVILEHYGIIVDAKLSVTKESFFQRLGMMHYLFECIKHFDFENTPLQELPINEEFVIQGNCIFNETGRLDDKLGVRTHKFVNQHPANSFRVIESSLDFRMVDCDSVFILSRYSIELFVTDNLNYYAYLELDEDRGNTSRRIIIPLNANDVISNLYKILKVVGADSQFDKVTLKKALAEEGASIPGITLLN